MSAAATQPKAMTCATRRIRRTLASLANSRWLAQRMYFIWLAAPRSVTAAVVRAGFTIASCVPFLRLPRMVPTDDSSRPEGRLGL